jgi:heme/copper-type cytochrome/quinol oxidase subunit 2
LIGSSLGQYVVVLLVVVITFGVCFVLGVTAIAGYFIWRQRYRGSSHDDLRPTDEGLPRSRLR